MQKLLSDKTVLVTGAGRGLGAHIAQSFAENGSKVALNYRNSRAQAEQFVQNQNGRAGAFQADVRDPLAVKKMIDEVTPVLGAPDVVVHNALTDFQFNGDARSKMDQLTGDELRAHFDTGPIALLNLVQACLPGMKAKGGGQIVVIGTNLFQNPVVPYHDYTASKAALLSLVRTLCKELGQHNITINMISGGLLRTTDASAATPDEVFDYIAAQTPLGKVTTPQELADACLFFASPWARGVTGQNLIVDGGLTHA
jgi:3-oxoacyl-[acyl-carrier protein] reductase